MSGSRVRVPRRSVHRARVDQRPQWRRQIDALGGPLLLGSLSVVMAVVAGLIWLNRPAGTAGGGAFELVARAPVAGRTWGSPSAPVRIVAFEDFQCPFCAEYTRTVEPLLGSEFIATGTVQYEYHHLAFLGDDSLRAAQAAECAVEQDQFWPFHDLLFLRQGRENSGAFSVERLKGYGREVDGALAPQAWDQSAFEGCLDSGRTRATVERMTREANEVGARSTPTLLVNGRLLPGMQTVEQLRQAIAQASAEVRP